jgi:hypothetical protein
MRPTTQFTLVLAALYHESSRVSVAAGDTLAHSAGQARPFTEFGDLEEDARDGRLLTAMNLEQRIQITGLIDLNRSKYAAETVERLAYTIHEAEREAIELGKVVVKLNPPRPWIPFEQLPEVAQAGRRRQAAFFLARFEVAFLT